jgi:hypothetical protein
MDQRKVNMLAREYCEFPDIKKKRKFKPIILSHHMLMGLKQGQAKMSKSDPDSAIFMEDEAVRLGGVLFFRLFHGFDLYLLAKACVFPFLLCLFQIYHHCEWYVCMLLALQLCPPPPPV